MLDHKTFKKAVRRLILDPDALQECPHGFARPPYCITCVNEFGEAVAAEEYKSKLESQVDNQQEIIGELQRQLEMADLIVRRQTRHLLMLADQAASTPRVAPEPKQAPSKGFLQRILGR